MHSMPLLCTMYDGRLSCEGDVRVNSLPHDDKHPTNRLHNLQQ